MRSTILVAAVVLTIGSSAFAQNAAQRPATPPPSTATQPANQAGPSAGANSFTEAQAKSRIEAGGYANVSALKKDEKGVWRGTAMKDGKSVQISLDVQGNVVAD
jgi:putative membrane protein